MRLSLALGRGVVSLPEAGRVLLLRPPGDLDLGGLPVDRLWAHQPFRPDHDALAARGVAASRELPDGAAAAVLFVPRSRALARDLAARAVARLPEGAPLIVDGAKADGVEALLRDLRDVAPVGEVWSKAHGKVFALPAPARLPDGWRAPPAEVGGWTVAPGVFSADGPDPGSAALADALPPLSGAVCDLGAGWGYLSARVLAASPAVASLDMVEAEAEALDCARANVGDPRARARWADAARWDGGPYDAVVCNPPFHPARRADPSLGRAFIAAAARMLAPRGRAWFVANRHLPYEGALGDAFGEVSTLAEGGGYKVVEAARPRGARGGRAGGRPGGRRR